MSVQPPRTAAGLARSALLLFGGYTFAYSVLVAVHELGHFLTLRALGVANVTFVLHPFTGSKTIWDATDEFIGTVDVAGPLAAVVVGVIITAAIWALRRPVLVPLLLLGPVACLTEGVSNFMQIALRSPGSDAMRIVEAGVPGAVVATVSVLIFLAGMSGLVLLLPVVGLSPDAGFSDKAMVLGAGLGAFMLVGVVYGVFVDGTALSRNGPQLAFALVMALVLAAIYRPVFRFLRRGVRASVRNVQWAASWLAVSFGVVVVGAQLVSF